MRGAVRQIFNRLGRFDDLRNPPHSVTTSHNQAPILLKPWTTDPQYRIGIWALDTDALTKSIGVLVPVHEHNWIPGYQTASQHLVKNGVRIMGCISMRNLENYVTFYWFNVEVARLTDLYPVLSKFSGPLSKSIGCRCCLSTISRKGSRSGTEMNGAGKRQKGHGSLSRRSFGFLDGHY